MVWFSAAVVVAAGLAACGGGKDDELDAGPPTSHRRFPAAVVSTTTPSTPPFGVTVKPSNTTTTRKPSGGGTGTTIATTTTSTPGGRVKPAETPLPVARTGVAGAAWQGLVVVAGGVGSGGGPSVRVDAFDPRTGVWSRGPNLPVALRDTAMTVLGTDLWVVGGFATEGDKQVAQDKTYYFHPGDENWHDGPTLHTPRGGPAAATLGNFLVVLGGETDDGTALSSVEVLASGGSAWKNTQAMSTPRAYASALPMNGRIYAIGGKTDAATAASSVESWRSGSSGWRTESRMDRERVRAAGAGVCDAGGQNDEGVVTTIECFGTGFWITQAQMRVPRYGLAAVLLDGWLHLIGGSTAGTTIVNSHEVIDLAQ
jgi:hypothetical protein